MSLGSPLALFLEAKRSYSRPEHSVHKVRKVSFHHTKAAIDAGRVKSFRRTVDHTNNVTNMQG